MRWVLTSEEIEKEIHKIYLEEDDLLMEGEWIEGEGKEYILHGIATIEGERYHDFEIAFALEEEIAEPTAEEILLAPWDWYDFVC